MMHRRKSPRPFHLMRFFSLTSLLSILIVAMVMIFFYRFMVVHAIDELSAELNTQVARNALGRVEEDLKQFIVGRSRSSQSLAPIDADLMRKMDNLIDGSGLVKIKIYSRDGTVIFSTNREQIGRNQIHNEGFVDAIRGEVSNKLVYRDLLNPFDQETSDANLIQTYLPVLGGESQRPIGVFEVYSDANGIVNSAAKAQLFVIPVVLGILLMLYLFLLSIVRNANATIAQQQNVISERTQTLEILSAKLLNAQEDEKKRLAEILHESVAQSLLAIKLGLENQTTHGDNKPPDTLVALIQDAIEQTRTFALELRPSALDDFGVVEALNTFLGETLSSRHGLQLEWEFEIDESDIPNPLKSIIFRTVQDTLNGLIKETGADRILLTLIRNADGIQLAIADNSYACQHADSKLESDAKAETTIVRMRERTVLSGGDFDTVVKTDNTTLNTATWPV